MLLGQQIGTVSFETSLYSGTNIATTGYLKLVLTWYIIFNSFTFTYLGLCMYSDVS